MDERIIFVYNANSSLFAQLTDYAHKIISPQTYKCNLCRLTYGNLGMKREWKEFIQHLSFKIIFLHKDEFLKDYPSFSHVSFPAVFKEKNGTVLTLITSKEINNQQSLEELKNVVDRKLTNV